MAVQLLTLIFRKSVVCSRLVYNMTMTTLAGTLVRKLANMPSRCQNAATDAVPFIILFDERQQ